MMKKIRKDFETSANRIVYFSGKVLNFYLKFDKFDFMLNKISSDIQTIFERFFLNANATMVWFQNMCEICGKQISNY